MLFFIDSQGTVVNFVSSPVYQGSTNASEVVLVAPFSASNTVEAHFRLPNGINTKAYFMSLQRQPMQIDNVTYNVWRVLLDGTIAEYAGQVSVWFKIHQSGFYSDNGYNPIQPTTYQSTFTVQRGGVPNLEDFPDTPTQNIYSAILDYLAQMYPQYNIMSVSYSAPDEYKITDEDIDRVKGIDGISEADMKYGVNFVPENVDGSNRPFYALRKNILADTGFTVYFTEPQLIGKMQLNISGAYYLTEIEIRAILEGGTGVSIDTLKFLAPSATNIIVDIAGSVNMIDLPNKKIEGIEIVQPYEANVEIDSQNETIENKGFTNGRFYINAIKLWQVNTFGQITITSSTGRTIIFPDASYDEYVVLAKQAQEYAEQARDVAAGAATTAEKWAIGTGNEQDPQYNNSAKYWAELVLNLQGKAGGFPILEDIGGQPKIPSVYINLIDPIAHISITSEDELAELDSPVGTIARLVIDIDNDLGTKTVTKSFVKLQEGTGADKWALYATSYADNASNALYAEEATNARTINNLNINGVLSETEYNDLPDVVKNNGVFFVSIEAEATQTEGE